MGVGDVYANHSDLRGVSDPESFSSVEFVRYKTMGRVDVGVKPKRLKNLVYKKSWGYICQRHRSFEAGNMFGV